MEFNLHIRMIGIPTFFDKPTQIREMGGKVEIKRCGALG